MANNYEVYCDQCDAEIKVKLKITDLENDVQKTSFNCTECGKEYVVSYTDADMRRKQVEVNLLQKKLKRPGNARVNQRQFKRYIELKNQLKVSLGEMKHKYKGVDE